jgi:hypothetical protein
MPIGENDRQRTHPGLLLVAIREIRFFRRDRAGWLLVVAIPIAFAIWHGRSAARSCAVSTSYRQHGPPASSNDFIDQIAAAPGVRITQRAEVDDRHKRSVRGWR